MHSIDKKEIYIKIDIEHLNVYINEHGVTRLITY